MHADVDARVPAAHISDFLRTNLTNYTGLAIGPAPAAIISYITQPVLAAPPPAIRVPPDYTAAVVGASDRAARKCVGTRAFLEIAATGADGTLRGNTPTRL